jgi:predicted cupin superfamily sugar epimerase
MHPADFWIEHLQLSAHPEGGYFREIWRSPGSYRFPDPSPFRPERSYSTSIYYLLKSPEHSRLHRIRSDELWFFHEGNPLTVFLFHPDGTSSSFTLGNSSSRTVLQGVVPAETWFGAALADPAPEAYALASCVVAPGFDFRDFSFPERSDLVSRFPLLADLIDSLL